MASMPMVPSLPPIPSSEGKTITNGLAASASSSMLEIKDPFVGTHREQIPEENAEGAIPGYKGFIRGSQHFYGSTYGRMSRRASAHEFGPDPEGNPVDEVPHGISGALKMGSTFPSTEGEGDDREAKYRLPGYAGYVPGSKFEFASTFGPGRQKRATCPPSKAPISAVFRSFRLIFGRAIISRNGLDAWVLFPERARAEHSR